MWSIHRVFHMFKISDLGAMMSIITELTAKGTREDGFNSIVISSLTPVVIAPLGVLIALIIVVPSRLFLLGVIPALTWVVIVPVFSFLFVII